MNFVFIYGPPAAGKMTVGQELEKLTGYKLFHNHIAIEPALLYFEFGTEPFKRIVKTFRELIFEEAIKNKFPGLIFTYAWAFNEPADLEYVKSVRDYFLSNNARVYFVGLEADLETRLERNKTENRMLQKPSKRDTEWSDRHLLEMDGKYEFNSNHFPLEDPHLRISNSNLSATETALYIKEKFSF